MKSQASYAKKITFLSPARLQQASWAACLSLPNSSPMLRTIYAAYKGSIYQKLKSPSTSASLFLFFSWVHSLNYHVLVFARTSFEQCCFHLSLTIRVTSFSSGSADPKKRGDGVPGKSPAGAFLMEVLTRRAMCLESGMCDLRSRFKRASAKPINSPELRHRKVLEESSFTDPFF